MKDILLIAHYMIVLGAIGFMLYVFFNRLIDIIQQKRADDMRKAYQARKAALNAKLANVCRRKPMQPAYATLINELVQEYHTKRANLRAATATPPELQQQLDDDYAYRLSIGLEDALEDAYSAGDIDSARQIDRVIRRFYTGQGVVYAA
ncbi:hypothetical protein SGGMMB4_04483 [Sodalis glossinidius str. 'morsitans']|nr:hypothetical protein [Sodalis glossinidius]CRL46136.1 hypothetical protein SGGMMB4_04483 [Sodalis glossinidius str. 'morsitans']